VERARRRGLDVRQISVDSAELDADSYDLVLLIQTIEHVADPLAVLRRIGELLRPGGRLLVVTDNTASLDFRLNRSRHWGGYHFPRHWNLFDQPSLRLAAERAGLEVDQLGTMMSPVNWTYSVRNRLVDHGAPQWLVEQFSLSAPLALGVFTLVDSVHTALGRGALLRAVLRRPR
jgi:SAM-dependent methyltransferase